MSIQPLPLYVSLSTRFADFSNGIIIDGNPLNEFMWLRLLEDAEKVSQSDLSWIGDAFISALYAIKGNKELWEKYFLRSTAVESLESCDYGLFSIHMNSAGLVSQYKLGSSRVKESVRNSNDIDELLESAEICMQRGLFESAHIAVQKLIRLNVHIPEQSKLKNFESIDWLYYNRSVVNEDDILDRLASAYEVAFEATGKADLYSAQVRNGIPGTGAGIQYLIRLDEPIERLVDIDWLIAEKITNSFEDSMADVITFSTIPKEI